MANEIATTQGNIPAIPDDVKALLAEAARNKAETEVTGIPFLSLKNKRFTLGEVKLGTELDVVILADVYDHSWYDRPYKEDVIIPPACFAIGAIQEELAPHPDSPTPQSEECIGCPQNEFGSALQGKGKACRNGRRLLIAPYTHGQVELRDLAIINISPTTLKSYSKYIMEVVGKYKVPTFAVVSRLSFDDDKAYPLLLFKCIDVVTDGEILRNIMGNQQTYLDMVSVPYNVAGFTPLVEQPAGKSKLS
jgi:hypothetical protein